MNKLTMAQANESLKKVPEWKIDEQKNLIYRQYNMKNFTAAIELINKIARIAEEDNHHPDIHLTDYRVLRVELTTHKAGGLTEQDFIEAGKINSLPAELKQS